MERVDIAILMLLNDVVQRSPTLDVLLVYLLSNTPAKGLLFASLMWWAWFRSAESKTTDREVVISTLLAGAVSVSISQLLQRLLPFRPRPVFLSALDLKIPYTGNAEPVLNLSSFPSDHAAFFYALAMGFWFLSRRLGTVLLVLVTVLICLPRLILGYHYPTDVIAGALIGFGTVYLIHAYVDIGPLSSIAKLWEQWSAGTLYMCFFILYYLIATFFEPLRSLAKFIRSIVATIT